MRSFNPIRLFVLLVLLLLFASPGFADEGGGYGQGGKGDVTINQGHRGPGVAMFVPECGQGIGGAGPTGGATIVRSDPVCRAVQVYAAMLNGCKGGDAGACRMLDGSRAMVTAAYEDERGRRNWRGWLRARLPWVLTFLL